MDSFVFEYRVRVTDTDLMGVMHHHNYPRLFEWTREEYFRGMGHAFLGYIRQDQYLAALSVSYRMTGQATYDQVLRITPHFTKVTKARMELSYEVVERESGNTIARGTSEHAILTGEGKVVRIPADFIHRVVQS
jgi:acyl-CoA thioester hydrolase